MTAETGGSNSTSGWTMRIRRATSADAELLSAFALRVFMRTFGPDNRPEDMEAYAATAFTPDAQRREIGDPTRVCLLAGMAGARAGGTSGAAPEIAAYTMLRVGSSEACVTGEAPVEIERFYVDHAWHGQGMANRLMDAAIAEARAQGGRTLWLGVWERNPRAIRFYEKCGFADVGSHPFVLGTDVQTDRVLARAI